jgi:predicted amidophosphoribosyltransferase
MEDRPQQSLLDRAARMTNLQGQFATRVDLSGQSVLLVDDVLTTGETARQCCGALCEGGARVIGVLTLSQAD